MLPGTIEQENIRLVEHLCDVVNRRNYDEMDKFFAASFVDRNPAWTVTNLEELKKIISAAHQALDQQIIQDEIFSAKNRVVVLLTFHGKHIGTFLGIPATNKLVSWTSIEIYRIEDGKIVERWVQADTLGLMRQFGLQLPS
ncbi:ester cyclase [Nostoc punctiforme UO1]|uniref:ester cyclase n=1 Tax=Nostoc punctiforme TaxID=272131 RepID=UPI0030A8FD93